MTTAIEKAERDLNALEEMRESLFSRAKLLSKERDAIAFAALTAGDKKSKDRLREVNLEDVGLSANIASVESALVVARSNLKAAEQAEAGAADREKANLIAAKNEQLKQALENADDAFADAIGLVLDARTLLQEIHALGVASPTDNIFRINAVAAIKTVIQLLPQPWINDFEFMRLSPSQKKTFKPLAAGWCNQIENQLPKKQEDANAA